MEAAKPKVIAFDLFNTVFDMKDVPRDEIRAYIEHCQKPEWSPLELPKSWSELNTFYDAPEGIRRLRHGGFNVVAMSNCPDSLAMFLFGKRVLLFRDSVPLACYKVFKPKPRAYLALCVHVDADPADILMVTANEYFGATGTGDCQEARKLGMQAVLLDRAGRNDGGPKTIIELAERLGC